MPKKRRRRKPRKIAPPRRTSNPALHPIGTPEGPLTLRADAAAARYQEMMSWIALLERLIAVLPNQRPGIWHNRPPIDKDDVNEITQAVTVLKAQPIEPDNARAAGSTLKKIGERLGTYLDTFLLEASKSAGKEFGKKLVQLSYWWALYYALMNIAIYVGSLIQG